MTKIRVHLHTKIILLQEQFRNEHGQWLIRALQECVG